MRARKIRTDLASAAAPFPLSPAHSRRERTLRLVIAPCAREPTPNPSREGNFPGNGRRPNGLLPSCGGARCGFTGRVEGICHGEKLDRRGWSTSVWRFKCSPEFGDPILHLTSR